MFTASLNRTPAAIITYFIITGFLLMGRYENAALQKNWLHDVDNAVLLWLHCFKNKIILIEFYIPV